MPDWKSIRESIPATQNYCYLMSAAAAPLHPAAYRALSHYSEELYRHGDAGWENLTESIEQTRSNLAKLLNAQPHEITFASSTSMAMNFIAMLIQRRLGRKNIRALSMRDEFPSSTLPFVHHGFELEMIESERGIYSKKILQEKVKGKEVLISSHIQYATGFRQNLESLVDCARSNDALSVLNMTQSLGAFPVNAKDFDFVAGSIHKWLMAGYGLSVMKISEEFLDVPLPVHGWLSEKNLDMRRNDRTDPLREARALEAGVPAIPQILAIGAVLKWIAEIGGIEEISKRILELAKLAREKLRESGIQVLYEYPEEHQSGIILVGSKNPLGTVESLKAQKILVSPRGAGIRMAIHYFNNEKDIERFIEAFKKIES